MTAETLSDEHPSYRPLGRLPLFRSGKTAYLRGREMTVSYVHIKKGELLVHLDGHANAVPAEHLEMEPTELLWPPERLEEHRRFRKPPTVKAEQTAQTEEPAPAAEASSAESADDIFAQAMALSGPATD